MTTTSKQLISTGVEVDKSKATEWYDFENDTKIFSDDYYFNKAELEEARRLRLEESLTKLRRMYKQKQKQKSLFSEIMELIRERYFTKSA